MNKSDIEPAVKKWVSKNNAKFIEYESALHIEKNGWGVEVQPQEKIIALHGYGSLNGISTNIEDIAELGAAVKRLTKEK